MRSDHVTGLFLALLIVGFFQSALAASGGGRWEHEGGVLELDTTPQRVVALNWAATEALLLLGVTPVGVADRDGYPVWVKEPALPEGIENVGMRSAPSLEAIASLKPDLIVTSAQLAPAAEQLRHIAPLYVVSVYDEGSAPFERARDMLLTLGEILDRESRAKEALAELDSNMARQREKLEAQGLTDRPIALINFMDARHVRINTPNGLFQKALEGLGLENAWQQPGNFWGFSLMALDRLAPLDNARLVAIDPVSPAVRKNLADSPFWNRLPSVQQNAVYRIEPVWAYGGVNSVDRMARLLSAALLEGGKPLVD